MASARRGALPAALALFSFLIAFSAAADKHGDGGIRRPGKERVTRLHFYFQEINGGLSPSAVRVAEANATRASPFSFGAVVVADNPLTEGPELTSRTVGRAQGMYASAARGELSFATAMNYGFTGGKYDGSVLTIMGRNAIAGAVRELSVVGGSGYFRLARGYALISTYRLDPAGLVTVEYNVTVFHAPPRT